MFVSDPLAGNSSVVAFIFLSQWVVFTFLLGQFAVRVELLDTDVASVSLALGIRV